MPTVAASREKYFLMLDEEHLIEKEVAEISLDTPPFIVVRIGNELEPRIPLSYLRREDIAPRVYQSETNNGLWLCLPFASESEKYTFLNSLIDSDSFSILRDPNHTWWGKSTPLPPLDQTKNPGQH